MPRFAHGIHFSFSRIEGGPQDGCRVTPPAETGQPLPAFYAVDAFLQNSLNISCRHTWSSSLTLTDIQQQAISYLSSQKSSIKIIIQNVSAIANKQLSSSELTEQPPL